MDKVVVKLLYKEKRIGRKQYCYNYVYECSCGKTGTRPTIFRHLVKKHQISPEEAKRMIRIRGESFDGSLS